MELVELICAGGAGVILAFIGGKVLRKKGTPLPEPPAAPDTKDIDDQEA